MRRLAVCLLPIFIILALSGCAQKLPVEPVPTSSLTQIPEYNGSDYVVINGNLPDFSQGDLIAKPYVHFSELDKLGRTGTGMAYLGPETLPTESRGEIGSIRPSGWHTVRYDDLIEDKYLFNRCHIIGYLLCGDNATQENLFTGTRYLNVTSMLPFEISIAEYIESTGNHVLYRCSPKYIGDNLLASGVQLEAYSVEDNGRLCFNVFVFNIQPGITINYANGDSEKSN